VHAYKVYTNSANSHILIIGNGRAPFDIEENSNDFVTGDTAEFAIMLMGKLMRLKYRAKSNGRISIPVRASLK